MGGRTISIITITSTISSLLHQQEQEKEEEREKEKEKKKDKGKEKVVKANSSLQLHQLSLEVHASMEIVANVGSMGTKQLIASQLHKWSGRVANHLCRLCLPLHQDYTFYIANSASG